MARAGETLLWWVALVGLWVSTLSTITTQELVAAAVAGVPCALVAMFARRAYGGEWRLSRAWSLPVAIVRDCAKLFSRETGIHRIPVEPHEKAVKTMVVSASPGTVVLDDEDDLTVHTLGRQ
ncbi:hypothetical protein [Actinocrispum sp. NPDC049592]|uniref:hypothetical protein n=1 Tax=Actinocrispum sp. NPDC049592 TaxID=3154835 RepID=UPI00342CD5BB